MVVSIGKPDIADSAQLGSNYATTEALLQRKQLYP